MYQLDIIYILMGMVLRMPDEIPSEFDENLIGNYT